MLLTADYSIKHNNGQISSFFNLYFCKLKKKNNKGKMHYQKKTKPFFFNPENVR